MSITTENRALWISSFSTPPQLITLPVPQATQGSVVIRVLSTWLPSYTGLAHSGHLKALMLKPPFVPGPCSIGRIQAVGSDAVKFKPGDLVFVDCTIRARDDPSVIILQGHLRGDDQKSHRILWEQWRDGALQQFYKVPMENVFPLDEDRLLGELKYTPAELPTLVLYLVAAGALIDVAKVKTGETVVIGPSGGAFGGSAVELALTLGANVIALGRNKEKLAAMKDALGNPTRLQYVVMTGNEAKDGAAIKEATPKGQGFDVYNDWTPGGSPKPLYLPAIVHGIKVGGRMIMSGSSDGNVVFPYSDMLHKNLSLMGSFMYTRETIPMIINMVTSGMLAGIGRKDGAEVTVFGLDQHVEAIEHAAKNGAWRRYTMIAPNVE